MYVCVCVRACVRACVCEREREWVRGNERECVWGEREEEGDKCGGREGE